MGTLLGVSVVRAKEIKKRYIPKVKVVKEVKKIDKEAVAFEAKKRMLLHRYNLEYEDYLKMYADQNGKCKICCTEKELGTKGGLYVDHNHTTGKVRGLLCPNCNTMLGKAKEDINILKNTIKYIEDYK